MADGCSLRNDTLAKSTKLFSQFLEVAEVDVELSKETKWRIMYRLATERNNRSAPEDVVDWVSSELVEDLGSGVIDDSKLLSQVAHAAVYAHRGLLVVVAAKHLSTSHLYVPHTDVDGCRIAFGRATERMSKYLPELSHDIGAYCDSLIRNQRIDFLCEMFDAYTVQTASTFGSKDVRTKWLYAAVLRKPTGGDRFFHTESDHHLYTDGLGHLWTQIREVDKAYERKLLISP